MAGSARVGQFHAALQAIDHGTTRWQNALRANLCAFSTSASTAGGRFCTSAASAEPGSCGRPTHALPGWLLRRDRRFGRCVNASQQLLVAGSVSVFVCIWSPVLAIGERSPRLLVNVCTLYGVFTRAQGEKIGRNGKTAQHNAQWRLILVHKANYCIK